MPTDQQTVFILGAGFTRAFLPGAPLLTDDYDAESLKDKFRGLEHASRILELELNKNDNGRINLERLMTRLDGGMPYDYEEGVREELNLLLSEIKKAFEKKLREAKMGSRHDTELARFAQYCVNNGINCITFNYDDVLDQALWEVRRYVEVRPGLSPYWHPDGGYGFFCKPSISSIHGGKISMDRTSMLLVKLHGSINWRVKRGYSLPYSIDAIVHDERWLPLPSRLSGISSDAIATTISNHLEQYPFIVPPVLMKSALVEQPILRLIWSIAYKLFKDANQIIFIGYSLPITDLAATFLFTEAINSSCQIKVVNYITEEIEKTRLKQRYKLVFPDINDTQFDFRDALEWCRELGDETNG